MVLKLGRISFRTKSDWCLPEEPGIDLMNPLQIIFVVKNYKLYITMTRLIEPLRAIQSANPRIWFKIVRRTFVPTSFTGASSTTLEFSTMYVQRQRCNRLARF
jgi:hypothetical protein